MRINVYSQELTPETELVSKVGRDKDGTVTDFWAVHLFLHSADQLHHTPTDDDRSAVTIWLPRSAARRLQLAETFRRLADLVIEAGEGGS